MTAVGFLWGAQVLGAAAAFLSQLMLARTLSVSDFGALATALASINVLSALSGFGVGAYLLRVFGKEGWAGRQRAPHALKIVLASSGLMTMVGLAWAWSGVYGSSTGLVMSVLLWLVVEQAGRSIGAAVLQLEGRYVQMAVYHFLPHGLRLIVASWALIAGWPILVVAGGYAGVGLMVIIPYARALRRLLAGTISLQGHGPIPDEASSHNTARNGSLGSTLKGASPFAVTGLFYLLYAQSPVVLLGMLAGEGHAGVYSVALSVMSFVYLFPVAVYAQYLMPHLHRWAEHDPTRLLDVYRVGSTAVLVASLVFTGLVAGVAPWGVPILFGSTYREAARLLSVLALITPVHFLAIHVGSFLTTGGHLQKKIRYQGIVALVSLCSQCLLIPTFGVWGAVAGMLVTELVLVSAYLYGAARHVFGRQALIVARPAPVGLGVLTCMAGVALVAGSGASVHGMLAIFAGSLAMSALLLIRYVKPELRAKGWSRG